MSSVHRSLHAIFSTSRRKNPKPTAVTTTAETVVNSKPPVVQTTKTTTKTASIKKQGRFEEMVERFKKCSESSEFRARQDIYFNTVRRLIKFNRFSMIPEILDHQKQFEDITNESFTSRLITLYGKAGFFDRARRLFDEMHELNCPRTVYSFNALLSACIDTGRFDDFRAIAVDLRDELGITFDCVSYNVIIKGYCKMGDLRSAELMVDEMAKKGIEPNLVTFNTLLQGFYGNGRLDDGERIWDQMNKMNLLPNVRSYNAKLTGLALKKRMKDAVELLEEMRLKGIQPDEYTFNGLIKGSVTSDSLEEAKKWYDELGKHNVEPDKFTFETLIPFLCKKGDLGFAFEACEQIFKRKLYVGKELLQLVVDGLVKESKIQEAKKLVQLAKANRYKLSVA